MAGIIYSGYRKEDERKMCNLEKDGSNLGERGAFHLPPSFHPRREEEKNGKYTQYCTFFRVECCTASSSVHMSQGTKWSRSSRILSAVFSQPKQPSPPAISCFAARYNHSTVVFQSRILRLKKFPGSLLKSLSVSRRSKSFFLANSLPGAVEGNPSTIFPLNHAVVARTSSPGSAPLCQTFGRNVRPDCGDDTTTRKHWRSTSRCKRHPRVHFLVQKTVAEMFLTAPQPSSSPPAKNNITCHTEK